MIRLALKEDRLTAEQADHISHFIEAFDTLAENRNRLMHSDMTAGIEDEIALFKTRRSDGQPILCRVKPDDLRQIADTMNVYFNYGCALVAIVSPKPGDFAHSTWPEKPAPPLLLEYNAIHRPVTRLRDL